MKRLQAEMKERAHMDRENHDLNLEKIRVKAAEDRATVLESVKCVCVCVCVCACVWCMW